MIFFSFFFANYFPNIFAKIQPRSYTSWWRKDSWRHHEFCHRFLKKSFISRLLKKKKKKKKRTVAKRKFLKKLRRGGDWLESQPVSIKKEEGLLFSVLVGILFNSRRRRRRKRSFLREFLSRRHPSGKREKKKRKKINAVILEESPWRNSLSKRAARARFLFIVTLKKNDEIKRDRLNEVEQEIHSGGGRDLEPSLRQAFFPKINYYPLWKEYTGSSL